MRTEDQRESSNVEDRRGMGKGTLLAGGGIGAIIMAIIVMLMGGDPSQLLNNQQAGPGAGQESQALPDDPQTQQTVSFVKKILASTEDVWNRVLPLQAGQPYVEPKLVLFTGGVRSGCGNATSETGPFYCPANGDNKVYLDVSFFNEMATRFKAAGDFAYAYVIAHEVGHHLQSLLGTSDKVNRARSEARDETEANHLSVRLELQADFYAGVWAHHAQKQNQWLEEGDLEEALRAANAIGDDRLQKQAQGRVMPDSFTHGTSEQRIRWFTKGFKSGDLRQGNTFNLPYEQL